MQLDKFEEEVGDIVDQASKEEKMETALVRLGETWAKMEFQFVQFGSTDVHTVKMAEEDFEALEDDQVLLQGMIANRCAPPAELFAVLAVRTDGFVSISTLTKLLAPRFLRNRCLGCSGYFAVQKMPEVQHDCYIWSSVVYPLYVQLQQHASTMAPKHGNHRSF